MLARLPWSPPPRVRPKAKRLHKAHFGRLVDATVNILRKGEPSPFAFEAVVRHAIRSRLCLKGWTWTAADEVASLAVKTALNRLGARRPTWKQGQPEWTQEGIIVIERTRCIRCGWQLPEGNHKFCSPVCFTAHHNELARRRRAEERAAFECHDET